jgi:probable phosphoglycerate mutase
VLDHEGAALLSAPFYFLRHGETELNRLGLVAGATDVPLNDTGWRQARAAAARLADTGIDAIWSSPLTRALDTARCVADTLHLEVNVIAALAERNWGTLEGKPRELRAQFESPPGGETLGQFRARTLRGIASISTSRAPLVVAHSGTFRVLADRIGLPALAAPVANSVPLRLYRDRTSGGVWMCAEV